MSTALTTASRLNGAATEKTVAEIQAALAAPFRPDQIKWKPQTISGNRALAVAYIDARLVAERLDEVVGISNWNNECIVLPDGNVQCRLSLRLDGEWVTKEDVGGPSTQPDKGDQRKAAFSDAIKRAAVLWGVGRYIYRLKPQWVDYDPQKKQITRTPTLPDDALPARSKAPKDGAELKRRLAAKDVALASAGAIAAGDIVKAVEAEARKGDWNTEWAKWTHEQVDSASRVATAFINALSSDEE